MSSIQDDSYTIRLGPGPLIMTTPSSERPIFNLLCAAAMIHLNTEFPHNCDTFLYAFRKKMNKGRHVVWCAPPPEPMIVDAEKEATKIHNNTEGAKKRSEPLLEGWEMAGMGVGFCKKYKGMKANPFARQTFLLAGEDVGKFMFKSERRDVYPRYDTAPPPPLVDVSKEKLRIEMFIYCADLIKKTYPAAIINFWIHGNPLNTYLEHHPAQKLLMKQKGELHLAESVTRIKTYLKSYLPSVDQQPLITPDEEFNTTEKHFEFDDLVFPQVIARDSTFSTAPLCQPLEPTPPDVSLTALPGRQGRVILDTNVLSDEHKQLVQLAKQLGKPYKLQIAYADAVIAEFKKGAHPKERKANLRRLLAISKTRVFTSAETPQYHATYFATNSPPTQRVPTGDLLIRQQIQQILTILDKARGKEDWLVEWSTKDWNCQPLMESIESPSSGCKFVSVLTRQSEAHLWRPTIINVLKQEGCA